ncbi:MAG: response regulator transcription factor [Oscillospiraceae bacterium]|nr:response regulator transcription factor [Oscillospiraceae bacterium]
MRILLAEDERSLSKAIIHILEKNHYSADAVYDGKEALEYLRTGIYDALILDVMMPVMDGIQVLQQLRREKNTIPVLILTAKAEVDDKVLGLDSGANDYLTKPFDTKELLARLRAMTRKSSCQSTTLHFGNISLDCAAFTLSSPDGSFRLTNKEFQMMQILLSNPSGIVPTERFLEKIWGYDSDAEINVVWVYISYLRKKLNALGSNIRITAVRNTGYRLEEIL